MQKRTLGNTDIQINPLGLGTVKFGRNEGVKYPKEFDLPSETTLADLLALAKDLGVNLIDTAPAYGLSEERLGRLLKGQREDWVIVGKAGEEFKSGNSEYIFTAKHFEMSLERSLKRLQTDYIDVFLIHADAGDDAILNNDALLKTMQDFKDRGLVRAIGASTRTIEGGLKTVREMDVVMAAYNPEYTAEKPILDEAAKLGKGVLLKKALSSGHNTNIEEAFKFIFDHPAMTRGAAIVGTINPDNLRNNAVVISSLA